MDFPADFKYTKHNNNSRLKKIHALAQSFCIKGKNHRSLSWQSVRLIIHTFIVKGNF